MTPVDQPADLDAKSECRPLRRARLARGRQTSARLPYALWGKNEYLAALGEVLVGRLNNGPHSTELLKELGVLFPDRALISVNSGSTALSLALKVLTKERPDRRAVLVPAYTCPSVKIAVESLGLEARPIEIGADLNLSVAGMSASISEDVIAVIAVHMYGRPAHIEEIERICRAANISLIDDAAQVAGIKAAGRPLGGFGDFGVLSFAQSKTIVTGMSGAGGILIVNDASRRAEAAAFAAELAPAQYDVWALLEFAFRYALFGASDLGAWVDAIARKLGSGASRPSPPAGQTLANVNAAMARQQLRSLRRRIDRRRWSLSAYAKALSSEPRVRFVQYDPGVYLARLLVEAPQGIDVRALRAGLASMGIQTRFGYPWLWREAPDSMPMARAAAQRLIELPCNVDSEAKIAAVVTALGKALDRQRLQSSQPD